GPLREGRARSGGADPASGRCPRHGRSLRPARRGGLVHPGFQTLLELGRSGNAVVKLSGPFRSSVEGYPYRDVDPFVAAVIEAFTLDRCVWGSDWPFVRMDERMDYGPPLVCLQRWLPDPSDRRTVLWHTPARLF